MNTEPCIPNPEYLIKSIAEQGYRLETALADLMDNSISANAHNIEVLLKMEEEPFVLYLADNGDGMNEESLKKNMEFPSTSPDNKRETLDLGRFGLGMKTASFSQTRCFTVLSRKKGSKKYYARTWDVAHLKKSGWEIIIRTDDEIDSILSEYNQLSSDYLNQFEDYQPNTIIIWKGLFKFEHYIDEKSKRISALKKEITEITTDYLSLVFHRFMERSINPIQIRINNLLIKPFNPFPTVQKDFRPIAYKEKKIRADKIKIEGFVLPSRSIDESNSGQSIWTTKNRGLMDMEGIYIYRADRIILFGEWLGIIKKGPRLQLARLRVEVGNSVDQLLQLNVAKSQVIIPHDLSKAFENYIDELKIEAEREFYNRGIRRFSGTKKEPTAQLFERKASNKGMLLEINNAFPILSLLKNELNKEQNSKLNLLLRMINTRVNEIRQTHEEKSFIGIEEKDGLSTDDLFTCINQLKSSGFTTEQIKNDILINLGYKINSFPVEILELLKS